MNAPERPNTTTSGSSGETSGDSLVDESPNLGGEFPGIDFATFVLSLSHSAYLHLGDAPNPTSGRAELNLTMARQTIDLLGLLERKTQGNLTGEEERILEQVLYELRLRYVEVSEKHG
ncbi:MAG TPA: DUF1844 domain-containing protein [Polyangiaceae bacterium]